VQKAKRLGHDQGTTYFQQFWDKVHPAGVQTLCTVDAHRTFRTGSFIAHPLFTSLKHINGVRPWAALKAHLGVDSRIDEKMTRWTGSGR
jgi:hypothetical protein